jgi:phospholipid transport system transporter-binding protein
LRAAVKAASFRRKAANRFALDGAIDIDSAGVLLTAGEAAVRDGADEQIGIDLAGVVASDSAGLALLIELISVARSANRGLVYENIPSQVRQLARLSEVEELLQKGA